MLPCGQKVPDGSSQIWSFYWHPRPFPYRKIGTLGLSLAKFISITYHTVFRTILTSCSITNQNVCASKISDQLFSARVSILSHNSSKISDQSSIAASVPTIHRMQRPIAKYKINIEVPCETTRDQNLPKIHENADFDFLKKWQKWWKHGGFVMKQEKAVLLKRGWLKWNILRFSLRLLPNICSRIVNVPKSLENRGNSEKTKQVMMRSISAWDG